MDVYIADKDLLKLYESGVSRKLRLPQPIVDKFFAVIQKIEAAKDIHDLWNNPSLNFEKYSDHYSVRLSGQYRMEMNIIWTNTEKTIGDFQITKVSNHYGD